MNKSTHTIQALSSQEKATTVTSTEPLERKDAQINAPPVMFPGSNLGVTECVDDTVPASTHTHPKTTKQDPDTVKQGCFPIVR